MSPVRSAATLSRRVAWLATSAGRRAVVLALEVVPFVPTAVLPLPLAHALRLDPHTPCRMDVPPDAGNASCAVLGLSAV